MCSPIELFNLKVLNQFLVYGSFLSLTVVTPPRIMEVVERLLASRTSFLFFLYKIPQVAAGVEGFAVEGRVAVFADQLREIFVLFEFGEIYFVVVTQIGHI